MPAECIALSIAHPTSPSKAERSIVLANGAVMSKRPRRANTARAAQVGTTEMPRTSFKDFTIACTKVEGFLAIAMQRPSSLSRHDAPAIMFETSSSGTTGERNHRSDFPAEALPSVTGWIRLRYASPVLEHFSLVHNVSGEPAEPASEGGLWVASSLRGWGCQLVSTHTSTPDVVSILHNESECLISSFQADEFQRT